MFGLFYSLSPALPSLPASWREPQVVIFANLAPWDRWLRLLVGAGLLFLGWWGDGGSLAMVALRIFGCLPVLTALLGWSPLYSLMGFSTRQQIPEEE